MPSLTLLHSDRLQAESSTHPNRVLENVLERLPLFRSGDFTEQYMAYPTNHDNIMYIYTCLVRLYFTVTDRLENWQFCILYSTHTRHKHQEGHLNSPPCDATLFVAAVCVIITCLSGLKQPDTKLQMALSYTHTVYALIFRQSNCQGKNVI